MASDDPAPAAELPEFIFGPLSTAAGRVRAARLERAGLVHPVERIVLAPEAGEPQEIVVQVGPELAVTAMELRYAAGESLAESPRADQTRTFGSTVGQHPAGDSSASGASAFPPSPDPAAPGPPAPGLAVLAMQRRRLIWDDLAWGYLEEWSATIPGHPAGTLVRYAISATTLTGERLGCPWLDPALLRQRLLAPEQLGLEEMERRPPAPGPRTYAYGSGRRAIPGWIREAVIYQVFVDRFAPDPGTTFDEHDDLAAIHGGTLRGLISRLDHLQRLGITCLWLTPIFPTPSHHGYDPIDPGAIEPRLGTPADWDELVVACRQRGIRILLDFVVNHVSNEHPRFLAAQADAADPANAWFRFREHPHTYDCFFDVPSQPELQSDHPEVRDYVVAHAIRWLERGCDGFRLDYAVNVSHAFWSHFGAATRARHPDSVTLGEITRPPAVMRSYLGRLDGCLDFHLLELLRAFFAFRTISASAFEHALAQHLAYFGDDLVLPSFLDNHDMNRFLWLVAGDTRRLRLAALAQFTLPQPPILYYGTEVGLSQQAAVGRLEESRLPMLWDERQDGALLAYFQELIALRRSQPQLLSQPRRPWLLDDAHGLLAVRVGTLLLLFNNSERSAEMNLRRLPAVGEPVQGGGAAAGPGAAAGAADAWARSAELAEPLLLTAPLEVFEPSAGLLRLAPWAGAVFDLRTAAS